MRILAVLVDGMSFAAVSRPAQVCAISHWDDAIPLLSRVICHLIDTIQGMCPRTE